MMSPAVNAHDARFGERGSPRSINPRRGRGKSLTSSLSVRCPSPLASCSLRLGAPLCSHWLLASSTRDVANRNGSASAYHGAGSPAVDSIDSDGVRLVRAGVRQATGTKRGGSVPGVDCSASNGLGAEPAVQLRRQLHPAS
jgi:hypothetical protein